MLLELYEVKIMVESNKGGIRGDKRDMNNRPIIGLYNLGVVIRLGLIFSKLDEEDRKYLEEFIIKYKYRDKK